MHMADALISPAVGGTFWMISGGLIAYSARKMTESLRDNLIPIMGVLGAFIFAAQMINFSIPGTGSSGHLGGGLILSVLLGPYAALLVISSVLTVQALFFADGGLLALGCNIFNLGFFPAFIAYPLIYRTIAGASGSGARAWGAALAASVTGLLLGALSVVGQTMASGITGIPIGAFTALMVPIHLAIGVVEGLATAVVVGFVAKARPEAIPVSSSNRNDRQPVLIGLSIATLVIGMGLSWFASAHPDGLEWSIGKATGAGELAAPEAGVHQHLADLQEKTSFLPDYGFKNAGEASATWPAISAGTSVSGLVGGLITLVVVGVIGFVLRSRRQAGTV
jgi:cobalt/nickel transport system permease protein